MKGFLLFILLFFISGVGVCTNINVILLDKNERPVEQAVAYLLPLEGQQAELDTDKEVIIKQVDKKFSPYISIVQKGMKVNFVNEDGISHSIFSALSKNRFSFKIKKSSSKSTEALDHTGKIPMACNIHDWMTGYLFVVDTPYYAQMNSSGNATITVNGEGKYKLIVRHPQIKENGQDLVEKEIQIDGDQQHQFQLTQSMGDIPKQENSGGASIFGYD